MRLYLLVACIMFACESLPKPKEVLGYTIIPEPSETFFQHDFVIPVRGSNSVLISRRAAGMLLYVLTVVVVEDRPRSLFLYYNQVSHQSRERLEVVVVFVVDVVVVLSNIN